MSKFGDPDYWIVPLEVETLIPRKDPHGAWLDCCGVPLDPQPLDPEVREIDEDGSVELILDDGKLVDACDLSSCKVLRSLSADDRSLQEELKAVRERMLTERAKRKKERKKRLKLEQKQLRHERRERISYLRWEKAEDRAHNLAVRNVELAVENERLVRAVLSRSIGFGLETTPEEMDHVIDALVWWCVTSGEDVDHRVDYWEMWTIHDSISDEVWAIVKEYDEHRMRKARK